MNWKNTVLQIIEWTGLSEAKIAARVGCKQPTIHRIKTGVTKSPSYVTGAALMKMHQDALRKRGRAA